MGEKPFRVLPRLTELNRHFWTGGAQGELRLLRCRACQTWIHPPSPRCPACLAKDVEPEAVSGRGTVASFTLNHQPWVPAADHPYVIAIVELAEQAGLRLTTNLVGCAPEAVRIGMSVRVIFEEHGEVQIPLFEPVP
ncbi:MAG: OB-fold domain-containing protein [Myxococcota bacterium]